MELARVTNGSIKSVKPCSAQEIETYSSHIQILVDAGRTIDLFEILRSAHVDYFEHIVTAVSKSICSENSLNPYSMDKFSFDTSRYFLNYLTAMRVFLDHVETRLKKKFGKGSLEVERFKVVTAEQFDSRISNRLFYKLRDYTQHCGLPPVSFNMISRVGEGVEVVFTLNVRVLLGEYGEWGARVTADLESYQSDPFLFELIDDHFDSMRTIFIEVFTIMHLECPSGEASNSLRWICSFLSDQKPDDVYAFLVDVQPDESGELKFGLRWIPTPVIRSVIEVVELCRDAR